MIRIIPLAIALLGACVPIPEHRPSDAGGVDADPPSATVRVRKRDRSGAPDPGVRVWFGERMVETGSDGVATAPVEADTQVIVAQVDTVTTIARVQPGDVLEIGPPPTRQGGAPAFQVNPPASHPVIEGWTRCGYGGPSNGVFAVTHNRACGDRTDVLVTMRNTANREIEQYIFTPMHHTATDLDVRLATTTSPTSTEVNWMISPGRYSSLSFVRQYLLIQNRAIADPVVAFSILLQPNASSVQTMVQPLRTLIDPPVTDVAGEFSVQAVSSRQRVVARMNDAPGTFSIDARDTAMPPPIGPPTVEEQRVTWSQETNQPASLAVVDLLSPANTPTQRWRIIAPPNNDGSLPLPALPTGLAIPSGNYTLRVTLYRFEARDYQLAKSKADADHDLRTFNTTLNTSRHAASEAGRMVP